MIPFTALVVLAGMYQPVSRYTLCEGIAQNTVNKIWDVKYIVVIRGSHTGAQTFAHLVITYFLRTDQCQ